MTDRDRLNFAIAYLGGALDEPQASAVRARLAAGDPAWVGAAAEAQEILARLSASAPSVEPSPDVKHRLMSQLAQRRPQTISADAPKSLAAVEATENVSEQAETAVDASPLRLPASVTSPAQSSRRPWLPIALAAGVLLLIGAGTLAVLRNQAANQADQRAKAQKSRADEAERELASLNAALGQPQSRLVQLGSTVEGSAQRFGRVVIDPANRRMVVYVFDLVPLSADKTYQLWFLPEGGAPVPAPTFMVNQKGQATITATIPPGVNLATLGAAISEEKAGGSQTPTVVRLVPKAG